MTRHSFCKDFPVQRTSFGDNPGRHQRAVVRWTVTGQQHIECNNTMTRPFCPTTTILSIPSRPHVQASSDSWHNLHRYYGGRHKSLDGNRYAQVFANDSFFAVSYPMEKKSSAGQALKQFIAEFGIPDRIVCDGSGEQMGKRTEFVATVRKNGIDLHLTEPD